MICKITKKKKNPWAMVPNIEPHSFTILLLAGSGREKR